MAEAFNFYPDQKPKYTAVALRMSGPDRVPFHPDNHVIYEFTHLPEANHIYYKNEGENDYTFYFNRPEAIEFLKGERPDTNRQTLYDRLGWRSTVITAMWPTDDDLEKYARWQVASVDKMKSFPIEWMQIE